MMSKEYFNGCDIAELNRVAHLVAEKLGFHVWYPVNILRNDDTPVPFDSIAYHSLVNGSVVRFTGTIFEVKTKIEVNLDPELPAWANVLNTARHQADFDFHWWQMSESLLTDILTRSRQSFDEASQVLHINAIKSAQTILKQVICDG